MGNTECDRPVHTGLFKGEESFGIFSLEDRLKSYQLVGEVMAHQGLDG
jgi:hypothetical protein